MMLAGQGMAPWDCPCIRQMDRIASGRWREGEGGMKIGYARVSTHEQNLDLQRDALTHAGCEKVIEDTASGGTAQRDGLAKARELLRRGDVLVVWRLDRLGRSLRHLIELMTELEGQGIGFQSITESIDTTSPGGKLVFHIFGALAEFERNLIRERTRAGLEAARARGRKGGRARKLGDKQRKLAVDLYRGKKHTIEEICQSVGITKPTLYAYVREGGGS
jgi:DNA invertase Pin-like site-specific DNA recombinase